MFQHLCLRHVSFEFTVNKTDYIFRNARKKEILKAYRKLAIQWHPDKHDGEDKEKAQKMFMDIAAAKEVLTDPGNAFFLMLV